MSEVPVSLGLGAWIARQAALQQAGYQADGLMAEGMVLSHLPVRHAVEKAMVVTVVTHHADRQ